MKISEIFCSLQGEGLLVGRPSVFVRLTGCPLRCRWCDTKYAWDSKSGREVSIQQILEQVDTYSNKTRSIVITGGEPMIQDGLSELCQRLKADRMHITIETAGIEFIDRLECDLMSISPKLSNSQSGKSDERINIDSLSKLLRKYDCQLKFVIEDESDFQVAVELLAKLPPIDAGKVFLMPQAATRSELAERSPMVAQLCLKSGFSFGQRLHVLLWDTQRGK
ncbi:MAG: 7-carboxy-7-deazaguanine synthase QueE [Phycisphaerae bacterium]|nr:7-carboxy-7-deazaguanine synthase QueE [Phycisphaerae bacterium]